MRAPVWVWLVLMQCGLLGCIRLSGVVTSAWVRIGWGGLGVEGGQHALG